MTKRCIEVVAVGQRCSRMAVSPGLYCWQHQPGSSPVKVAISFGMDAAATGIERPVAASKKASAKKKATTSAKKAKPAKKASLAKKGAAAQKVTPKKVVY